MSVFLCVAVEAPVQRKIGSISDYDPGNTPSLNSAYQPVGVSMHQRQEWEETVPISSSTPCMCSLALAVVYRMSQKKCHCIEEEMQLGLYQNAGKPNGQKVSKMPDIYRNTREKSWK